MPTASPDCSAETARQLRARKGAILSRWTERARAASSVAREIDPVELCDSLPVLIDNLATALEAADHEATRRVGAEMGAEHGAQRARVERYTVDIMVVEYRALRRAIFEVLRECVTLDGETEDLVNEAIDTGIANATRTFTSARGEQARLAAEALRRDVDEQLAARHSAENAVEWLHEQRVLREDFVSLLAHDLRQPLNTARIAAVLASKRLGQPEMLPKLVGKVLESIDRADRMIRDLLDANRIQAGGRIAIRVEPCELVQLVSDVVDEATLAHGDRFVLHSTGPIDGWWGCDDLRRALENLLGNALKYGADGTPVRIVAEPIDSTVRISVHNEGEPIAREQQSKLFERFQRARPSERGGVKGWGLGLTLVRGVAEAHGGTASVESREGDGTTFTMTLPRDARPYAP